MRKIFFTLPIALLLSACSDSGLFTDELTQAEKVCRAEAAEVAYQILATIYLDLTNETFVLSTTIEAYKNKGCSSKFVKNALNGMTTS